MKKRTSNSTPLTNNPKPHGSHLTITFLPAFFLRPPLSLPHLHVHRGKTMCAQNESTNQEEGSHLETNAAGLGLPASRTVR